MKKMLSFLVSCFVLFGLLGCSENPENSVIPQPVKIASIEISGSTSISVGGSTTITAAVNPSNASVAVSEWKIDCDAEPYSNIVTEAESGKTLVLTGKKAGSVKVYFEADGVRSNVLTVTVAQSGTPGTGTGGGTTASVTSVTLSQTSATLILGNNDLKSTTLTATVSGENLAASDKTVTWSVDPAGIVTVNNGVVTAVAKGEATVTATSTKDATKKASCSVKVDDGSLTYKFTASSDMNLSGATDNTAITANTTYANGFFSVSGTGAKGRYNGGWYAFETGKNESGCMTFTTNDESTVTIVAASTGGSNVSDAVLQKKDGSSWTAVNEDTGKSTVTGSSPQTTLVYTNIAAGTYRFGAFPASSNTRGVRIHSIEVKCKDSPIVTPTGVTLDKLSESIDLSSATTSFTLTATVDPANVTPAYAGVSWSSSASDIASVDQNGRVTGHKAGNAVITVTTNTGSYKATCNVTVTGVSAKVIRASDVPSGWAGYTGAKMFDKSTANAYKPANWGGYNPSSTAKVVFVDNRRDLINYAKEGGYVIYVNGMIDMSNGMLPSKAKESTDDLDAWIATQTSDSYKSLAEWKAAYAGACNTTTDDKNSTGKGSGHSSLYDLRKTLSNNYGSVIKLTVASNTTIIGTTNESGIKGGSIQLSSVNNVVIRNMIVQDPFDPFPQHEVASNNTSSDGYNANWDAVQIEDCKYVWIDHCTFRDTIANWDDDFDHVYTGGTYEGAEYKSGGTEEKWQCFDGLCDIKRTCDFITVSYTKFENHDKTSLIGHDGNFTADLNHQTITLHHNYYHNCKQRLPMVRFATIHIFNNYFKNDNSIDKSTGRKNDYCIGLREQNRVYAEKNNFGLNTTPTSNSQGNYYFKDNVGKADTGTAAWTPSEWYSYTADSASELESLIPDNAGAGKWPAMQ